jgi:signal transduction histidine kinase/CheY-like chemotaxis protein
MIAGFAAVWWERRREFRPEELALMEAIGSQVGVALENAQLFDENRRRVEELSVLHELSRAVTGQLDRAALLEAIRSQVARVLDISNLVVLLRGPDRGVLEVALRIVDGMANEEGPREYPPQGVGLMSIVLERGAALRSVDYAADCAHHGVTPIADSAARPYWLGVPVRAGDTVLGVLVLRSRTRAFTDADERLLANIGHLAGLALRSARLFEERTGALAELRAAQDQLVRTEKLRALGEMASGVAHDFNNLLASVLGRAQLLLRRIQEPQQRQWLQVIERAALDGAQTVRRLQEFTRIRRDHPLVPLDLTRIVRDALEITQSRWSDEPQSRGVTIEVRTALDPVAPVAGDAVELREAMTNLILNALDAMPTGGALTLATTMADDDHVRVTVADTGVGMPPGVRERIFDPFFTTKGPQGTGLGLSMTYGIISRHNASIEVDSEVGKGTTFRLTFARARGPAGPPPVAVESPPPAPALKCLVVDDEEAVGGVLGDILEAAGHTAVVLLDGAEAIVRFQAEPFDLVFTDLAMPQVSGWQVAGAIKQVAPGVPVVLVTGFGVELTSDERRAHGVDAVLVKPLQIQDVLDAVAEMARIRA